MIFNFQSIPFEYIKVRWQEPFVSEAVNRRFWGVFPKGIYSGFLLTATGPRQVTVGPGSVSGFSGIGSGLTGPGYVSGLFDETVAYSVAVHQNAQGYSTSMVLPPGIHQSWNLDLTGLDGQRVFVAIDVQYSVSQQTSAQIKLVNSSELDNSPSMIVVGHVDVPVNPLTPIDNANIGYNDPAYPRITPLSTPQKTGLMPASAWSTLGQGGFLQLLTPERNPNTFFAVNIAPSQKVVGGKRAFTWVQKNFPSRFPRDASEDYNGGLNDNAETVLNFATGIIGGAHQISGNTTFAIPSIDGTPDRWQLALVSIDPDDRILVQYGAEFTTKAAALDIANYPSPPPNNLTICFVLLSTDSSGDLEIIESDGVLDARTFLQVGGAGGGGGGGGLQWTAPDGEAPLRIEEYGQDVFSFSNTFDQRLVVYFKVPESYFPGRQLVMNLGFYSPSASDEWRFQVTSTLIRKNVDPINDTTNQNIENTGDVENTVALQSRNLEIDITDADGEINGVGVNPGDSIKIELERIAAVGTEDSADIRFIPTSTEIRTK